MDDLTATDKENIELFSALVDKIQTMNGDVSGNREIQALYEQITKLQAKVTASLEEAVQRQRTFNICNWLFLSLFYRGIYPSFPTRFLTRSRVLTIH